jgi:hypothetical protein
MKPKWRRVWPSFSRTGLMTWFVTGLVCVLTACPRRTGAELSSHHRDRLLFERAMAAADSGKFDVANLSLQTLINTCPNCKYAKKAKIALEDPRIARCGAGWNTDPSCNARPVATAPAEASSSGEGCVISQFRLALGIQPGMTRSDLLEVFTTEGGLSNRMRQTYVLKGCEIVHVDVTYSPIWNETDHLTEMPDDKIDTISKPYLDGFHAD